MGCALALALCEDTSTLLTASRKLLAALAEAHEGESAVLADHLALLHMPRRLPALFFGVARISLRFLSL